MKDRFRLGRAATRRILRGGRGNLAAVLVVCLAFAGTATAAALITGEDVKNNSLTGKDVKNRSLTARDFKGSVKGRRGAQGPQGARGLEGERGLQGPRGLRGVPGAPGSAVAYAKVNYALVEGEPSYTLDSARSKNVSEVNRTGSAAIAALPGLVCLDLSVPADVAVASAERLPVEETVIATVQMPVITGADRCPPGSDALVSLKNTNDEATESSFFVIFN